MDEIAGLLAGGGVLGVLATIVGTWWAATRADRRQYEDAIDRAEARADAAEQRAQAAWQVAEEARRARHTAEEALAELRRGRRPR